ncbi:MAG TPA: Arc family DNA-binding protein [Clostridia bacterium]|nr:Arc family DNA-binding protein [Clostridia bacterium]
MATENGLSVFSVRLPKKLADQIDARCKINRRTRNAEITLLLEQAIDLHVARDLQLLDRTREAKDGLDHLTT